MENLTKVTKKLAYPAKYGGNPDLRKSIRIPLNPIGLIAASCYLGQSTARKTLARILDTNDVLTSR